MTEQERIDRQTLLQRAAALAGAVYVAPALTASAAAETDRRPKRCPKGKTCATDDDCRNRKMRPCICCPPGTPKAMTCQKDLMGCILAAGA
jgi:hypothetical protein